MTLRAATATVTLLLSALLASAQQSVPQFTDPANLRGERVKPRDGRELPIDQGARGLEQLLRKLNTRASLMLIVAHPDDEDGGMLTYYSRGLGARVAVLTLTRGEGGQNAMTGDFEDALGLLRTQELLSADRYLGVDQFFGTEVDFGFSKTKDEAFKKWTHERVLYDAVRSIRLYRPLVIAAVFIGGVTDGHGQHQVSGQIAQEAFKAAADPTVFPDMIAEGILPWQALKVYARVPSYSISDKGLFDYATGKYTAPRFENYVTGEITTTVPSSDVIVHEGTTDPILSDNPTDPPRTYVQFARIGLGMQKSQIGGGVRVPPAGAFDIAYHLYGSALCSSPTHLKDCHPERSAQRGVKVPASPPAATLRVGASSHNPESASLFDGIDTSIEGIADLYPLPALKDQLRKIADEVRCSSEQFDRSRPSAVASKLATSLKDIDLLIKQVANQQGDMGRRDAVLHELRVKRVQLNDALALALGLSLKATAETEIVLDGGIATAKTSLTETSSESVRYLWGGTMNTEGRGMGDGVGFLAPPLSNTQPVERDCALGPMTITRPYFNRQNGIEQPFYDLSVKWLRNAPFIPPALTCVAGLEYRGAQIDLQTVAVHEAQPIQIVPSLNVSFSTSAQSFPVSSRTLSLTVFDSSVGHETGFTGLQLPPTWLARPSLITPKETTFTIDINGVLHASSFLIRASGKCNGLVSESVSGYRPIGYGDLPRTNYYTPATVRIVPVDLNLPDIHRIAYLPGTGDAVPEALASINLKPDILTVADLTPAKLAQFDTVILGVRTYNAHPDLHGAPTQALLDYARNGGNVLVQYQTYEFSAADAPYPLALGSNEKVVDETDPVQLLDAYAPFLTTPNKITPADFNNWVEERGHGFLSTWDPRYTPLTETHDPDQDPQRGGLITTNIGKGRWTYCAFALYRQLPEAVPGAFRLFVNLITPMKDPPRK